MKALYLNVSELPAPEPFDKIMRAIANLESDQYLMAVHRKQPFLLYSHLLKLDFQCHVQIGTQYPFEIYIWRKCQRPPLTFQQSNLAELKHNKSNCGDC
jgi:hypothetical protein